MAVKNLLIRGGADFSNMHNGLNNAQKGSLIFKEM